MNKAELGGEVVKMLGLGAVAELFVGGTEVDVERRVEVADGFGLGASAAGGGVGAG